RRTCLIGLPLRCLYSSGYQIIHESSSLDISVFVVSNLLHKRDRQALGEPSVNLTFDDHRINNASAIIHRHKPADLYLAGAPVNIDNADIGAKRKSQIGRIIIMTRFESRLQPRRDTGVRSESDLLNRLSFGGYPFYIKSARLPFEIFFADLKQMAG